MAHSTCENPHECRRTLVMQALVTGGTGFLGRHLVQRLLQEGEAVSVLARTSQAAAQLQDLGVGVVEGDVRRWSSLRQAVQGADVVFHCAGKAEPTGRWVDFLEVNVLGTERVIQAALEHGVRADRPCQLHRYLRPAADGGDHLGRRRLRSEPRRPRLLYPLQNRGRSHRPAGMLSSALPPSR